MQDRSSRSFGIAALSAFLILSPTFARYSVGQESSLFATTAIESNLKQRFRLTNMDLRVLRPKIKLQNEELVLELGKCIEAENMVYMSLWDKLRSDRENFETQGLTGLSPRQIKALRTARVDSESEVANEWVAEYLQVLNSTLDLDWLQTQYATQIFQNEAQQRLDLLGAMDTSVKTVDYEWRKLSAARDTSLRSVLTPQQIRDYDAMATPAVESLIAY